MINNQLTRMVARHTNCTDFTPCPWLATWYIFKYHQLVAIPPFCRGRKGLSNKILQTPSSLGTHNKHCSVAFNFYVNTMLWVPSWLIQMGRDNGLNLNRKHVSFDPATNIDMMFPTKNVAPLQDLGSNLITIVLHHRNKWVIQKSSPFPLNWILYSSQYCLNKPCFPFLINGSDHT